jgi:hypothetical protein
MKDPKVAKFMKALARRFPSTTMVTGPMPDEPDSGEICVQLLNAPSPSMVVRKFVGELTQKLWPAEKLTWVPVHVSPVSVEDTAKYYAHLVPKEGAPRSRGSAKPPTATKPRRRRDVKKSA